MNLLEEDDDDAITMAVHVPSAANGLLFMTLMIFGSIMTAQSLLTTGPCNPQTCQLPICRCPGTDIPGSLETNNVPQMVLLTFDGGITSENIVGFRQLSDSFMKNPNGCQMKYTFFISGNDNNFTLSRELHERGHEMASHTLTHRSPPSYWSSASYDEYKHEVVGLQEKLSELSDIPMSELRGFRNAFVEVGGEPQFKVLKNSGFVWDSTMVTGSDTDTDEMHIWPFTLDYPVSSGFCVNIRCPEGSYPGLWEFPLNRWYDDNKKPCSLFDGCRPPTEKYPLVEFFRRNFNKNYHSNRSPVGVFLPGDWYGFSPFNVRALREFLYELAMMDDVWVVSISQALDWIKNPKPLSELSSIPSWNCPKDY